MQTYSENEVLQSEELQMDARSLLEDMSALTVALNTAKNGQPLIFSLEISGTLEQLESLANDSLVKEMNVSEIIGDYMNTPSVITPEEYQQEFVDPTIQAMNVEELYQQAQIFANITPTPTPTATPTPIPTKPLYRLYLGVSGGWSNHLDSQNANEIGTCQRRLGYVLTTQVSGTKPLYRVARTHDTSGRDIKDDHLTTDTLSEVVSGSTNEGILGYVYTSQISGTIPLYRKYRTYYYTIYGGQRLLHTDHITTTDQTEGSSSSWVYERVLGYIMGPAASSCP